VCDHSAAEKRKHPAKPNPPEGRKKRLQQEQKMIRTQKPIANGSQPRGQRQSEADAAIFEPEMDHPQTGEIQKGIGSPFGGGIVKGSPPIP